MSAAAPTIPVVRATTERAAELKESLIEIRQRVQAARPSQGATSQSTLVAVSKYKPASDILACYDEGQRDFGENYVQELVEKASQLPQDIRWHFIGTFQSNKAKTLASISNLYALQTLHSTKGAAALNKALSPDRSVINVLLQVNTSGEDSKSGVTPLASDASESETDSSELVQLAKYILTECPRVRLQGLMTIGSLSESLSKEKENEDFLRLVATRDVIVDALTRAGFPKDCGKWGDESGRLLLSMGMSSDFEAALAAGSDIVRVGTGIFGSRPKKEEIKVQS